MKREQRIECSDGGRFRVVVGVGRGDVTSEQAVCSALSLAARGGDGEIHAVMGLPVSVDSNLDSLGGRMRTEKTWLADYVRWIADRVVRATPARVVVHVQLGEPNDVLMQVAFDVGASLIVVGARHRSRLSHALAPGVADRLLLDGRYPVLVARSIDVQGLGASSRPEPPRPGVDLTSPREQVLESSDRVDFRNRGGSHVSGLF